MAERKSFALRIPPELWEDLQRMAAEDLRSVNAQIEFLLSEAVRRRKGWHKLEGEDRSAD